MGDSTTTCPFELSSALLLKQGVVFEDQFDPIISFR